MAKGLMYKIINVISAIMIVAATVVLVSVLINPAGTAPSICGYSVLRVVSQSMEPTIVVDELLLVKKRDASEIEKGDIITFYSRNEELQGMLNTHRVVDIENVGGELKFSTKGDANTLVDNELVLEEDILGEVVATSVILGKIVDLLLNPIGFVIFIIIPLIIIIVINFINVIRTAKEVSEEESEEELDEDIQKEIEELKEEIQQLMDKKE